MSYKDKFFNEIEFLRNKSLENNSKYHMLFKY